LKGGEGVSGEGEESRPAARNFLFTFTSLLPSRKKGEGEEGRKRGGRGRGNSFASSCLLLLISSQPKGKGGGGERERRKGRKKGAPSRLHLPFRGTWRRRGQRKREAVGPLYIPPSSSFGRGGGRERAKKGENEPRPFFLLPRLRLTVCRGNRQKKEGGGKGKEEKIHQPSPFFQVHRKRGGGRRQKREGNRRLRPAEERKGGGPGERPRSTPPSSSFPLNRRREFRRKKSHGEVSRLPLRHETAFASPGGQGGRGGKGTTRKRGGGVTCSAHSTSSEPYYENVAGRGGKGSRGRKKEKKEAAKAPPTLSLQHQLFPHGTILKGGGGVSEGGGKRPFFSYPCPCSPPRLRGKRTTKKGGEGKQTDLSNSATFFHFQPPRRQGGREKRKPRGRERRNMSSRFSSLSFILSAERRVRCGKGEGGKVIGRGRKGGDVFFSHPLC